MTGSGETLYEFLACSAIAAWFVFGSELGVRGHVVAKSFSIFHFCSNIATR
jgi:hypothetical protein